MSTQNTFSIIIPTRERADTLYHTLRTVIDQTYDNLHIIVSDNFSQDNTQDVVRSFSDTRIRYINTGRRISMSENFEFGLNHVKDGFVMFIGDDDGLLPGAIQRVNKIVEETGVRAVTSGIAQYIWPNHPNENMRNKMSWSVRNDVEIRQSPKWIKKTLSFIPMYTFELPGLYCGFVHIDVVTSMKKNNIFFLSQTPDAYSAFACAVALDKYAFSHRPFTIHGASGRSNGASYFHEKNKTESELFFKENTIPFHRMLRICPSFRVIAAEAYLQLRDAFPEKTTQYQFDLLKLLSAALNECNTYSRAAIEHAVSEIAADNNIKLESVIRQSHNISSKYKRFVFKLSKLFPLHIRYSGVSDSSKIDVFNVYDAAKTMSAFIGLNDGIITSRYRPSVKRFQKLFRST